MGGGRTDLARALDTFMAAHRGALTPHTVVVLVSDAKTLAAAAAHLRAIRACVREVLWLNPLPRAQWVDVPTVAMFAPYCLMHECSTLGHLERITRRHLEPERAGH
ncbi:MAG: VWA domain-containing protein [Acetobacteraceae bacterium]|nr:VWA domain-containing protein [Acetobacteraceae bacterium]